MKYIFRILKSEYFLQFLSIVLLIFTVYNFLLLPAQENIIKQNAHLEIHNQGYEILDKKESCDRYGRPCFYYIVEYTDGCIEEMRVEADEYYKRIDE